MLYIIKK